MKIKIREHPQLIALMCFYASELKTLLVNDLIVSDASKVKIPNHEILKKLREEFTAIQYCFLDSAKGYLIQNLGVKEENIENMMLVDNYQAIEVLLREDDYHTAIRLE